MSGGTDLWARAMSEVEDAQQRDAGLWARCFAEADGDESRAKAAYIKVRVGQLSPKPATGYCPNCNCEVPLKADACPNCKAIFDHASSWAPTEKPQGEAKPRKATTRPEVAAPATADDLPSPKKGGLWRWVVGVPIGLFALVMVIGTAASDPDRTRDRQAYETCVDTLASADRARSGTSTFIAGACEKMRNDYIAKWGRAP